MSEYSYLIFSFMFSKSLFFHFFWHIIWWVCRAVTSFLLTQGSRLSGPFKYLEHVRKIRRKFSRSLKNIFNPKHFLKIKLKIMLEYSNKTSLFKLKLFFQRLLENFLRIWRTCSSYLKSPLNLGLYISKQIVTERHTNQIISQEKWKNWDFEK